MYQRLHPLPTPAPVMVPLLDHRVLIETSTGWLDLTRGPYELEASSFGEVQVSWRNKETTSDWAEGSFVASAVRDNVVESVSVWVRGETRLEHERAKITLTDALGQLSYRMMIRMEEAVTYWSCVPANYGITTSHEMRHARLALVKASIPRRPNVQVVSASLDEL